MKEPVSAPQPWSPWQQMRRLLAPTGGGFNNSFDISECGATIKPNCAHKSHLHPPPPKRKSQNAVGHLGRLIFLSTFI